MLKPSASKKDSSLADKKIFSAKGMLEDWP